MIKRPSCLAFVVAVTACAQDVARPPVAPPPIFREVSIAPFGRLALGAPLAPTAAQLSHPTGAGEVALVSPGGRFADTDSLLVRLDGDGHVAALRFVYVPGKDFAATVADYTTDFGAPATQSGDPSGAGPARAAWNDRRTRFELLRAGGPDRRVSSMLQDVTIGQP
jgi:hypothetical protein